MYKNIKKITLIVFVIGFFVNANAQLMRPFVSGGFTLSQIDGDEVYGFKQTGLTTGIGLLLPFNTDKPNDGFVLSAEILFSQRGAKNTNKYPFKYNCKLGYIDIPFIINYMDSRANAGIGVGVQYSRLIKTNERWTLLDTMIGGMDRPVDISNHSFKKNDFSIVADFRFRIWQGFKFDVRWQYSLVPIREDFEFFNSYGEGDLSRRTWLRDFKSNCVTFKIIYVINEPKENKYIGKKRKTAY